MYGLEPILETMLNVSIVIPAWNEQERINDCLLNATRQTVMPHEVIVVDNRSTDSTVAVVEQFMKDHPEAPVKLLEILYSYIPPAVPSYDVYRYTQNLAEDSE